MNTEDEEQEMLESPQGVNAQSCVCILLSPLTASAYVGGGRESFWPWPLLSPRPCSC